MADGFWGIAEAKVNLRAKGFALQSGAPSKHVECLPPLPCLEKQVWFLSRELPDVLEMWDLIRHGPRLQETWLCLIHWTTRGLGVSLSSQVLCSDLKWKETLVEKASLEGLPFWGRQKCMFQSLRTLPAPIGKGEPAKSVWPCAYGRH